jgi:hypothetical protein
LWCASATFYGASQGRCRTNDESTGTRAAAPKRRLATKNYGDTPRAQIKMFNLSEDDGICARGGVFERNQPGSACPAAGRREEQAYSVKPPRREGLYAAVGSWVSLRRPISEGQMFAKCGRMAPRGSRICIYFSPRMISRPTIRFCSGKPVSASHQAQGGLFRTVLGGDCTLSVHPVTFPPNARPVTGQLQFGHESEIQLSVQPGRVYPALFAESGQHRDKTASMTPESYCEAFGRPYVRP